MSTDSPVDPAILDIFTRIADMVKCFREIRLHVAERAQYNEKMLHSCPSDDRGMYGGALTENIILMRLIERARLTE